MDRRTKLKDTEKSLLQKRQRETWALAELEWLLAHLPPDSPAMLVGEIRHRLQTLRERPAP